ncbi:guanine nucleotide exchange factor for Rab-3A isoform X2 [Pleurodeles waltl]|uniref:guanine nucleotide exchange factor for Rab-3A isoform X2 n=1 Tax=Pleurodeles waltl TaxID=8319 RepID=UPI0037096EB8
MDVFEGLHSVDLSPVPSTSLGYDVIKAKDANTAVYTASAFFHQLESRFWPRAAEPESHRREDTVESHHNQSAVKAVGLQLSKQHPLGEWNHSEEVGNHVTAKEEQPPSQTYDVSRLRSSSVEIREKGSEILKEELQKAQKELKLKDRECERLSRVREQLEQELEELTASLFEEAHKMVREANTKQAASEKQLKEAQGKIDMLQAEVTALKTLVITSTPSSPNREQHPQLQSPSKTSFRKGHIRNKSTSSAIGTNNSPSPPLEPISKESREIGVPPLLSLLFCIVPGKSIHITYEPEWPSLAAELSSSSSSRQVDTLLFAEFEAWKESPTLDHSCPFLRRIYHEDIEPCLDFAKHELSELVKCAVEKNTLTVEPVASQSLPLVKASAIECGGPKKCALSGMSRVCKHRIQLGDSGNYYYISPSCRARITAVCNFFTYIRYIQQGLVRQDVEPMFWEIMRLRKEMSLAKLGFYTHEA